MIVTRQSEFFRTASMALQLMQSMLHASVLSWAPLSLLKSYSSIGGINGLMCARFEDIVHGNCNVQALLRSKHVTVVKVALLDSLDHVDVLLALQYAYFVASKGEHDN